MARDPRSGSVVAWRSYRVSVDLPAPLRFAYRWCTEYTADDAQYAGEDRTIHLQRRIVERGSRRVVFENLYDAGRGWAWERHVVTLRPPNRWHSEGWGNYHESLLDYELVPLSEETTRLTMRWRSRPVGLASGPRTPRRAVERYVTTLWERRAKALGTEYRATRCR